jgi:hypothetical protein
MRSHTLTRSLQVLLAVSVAPLAGAQVREAWVRLFDGAPSQSDYGAAVVVDAAGNSVVTGRSFNQTFGSPPAPPTQDIETVKYLPDGTQAWSARYQSPIGGDDTGQAIALSSTGDVYVTGQSSGYVGSSYVTQQTVLKYSSVGALAWSNQYGNPAGPNIGRSILVDAQGYVYVGGTEGGAAGTGDMCVRKLDPAGNVVWEATYDGVQHGYDYVYQIAFAPNGDIVAAGNTSLPLSSTTDFAVMRVSSTGTVLWAREVNGAGNGSDSAFAVAVDASGNAYAAGYTTTAAQGQDTALFAYDPAGTLLWSRNFNGTSNGNDVLRKVAIDRFGRVIALGGSTNVGTGTDFALFVYDTAGNLAWQRTWDGPAHLDDTARGLALDALGNIVVVGNRTLATDSDAVAIEYDPQGVERFSYAYAPGGPPATSERGIDAAAGPNASVWLTGYADHAVNNSYDYLTIRLDRTAVPFCFGDGSGTACPCGNTSLPIQQGGCLNSLGLAGRVIDAGASSLSADTFALQGTNMPASSALYFQGTSQQNGGAGGTFGDGLRCASGTTIRLSTKSNVGGASQYPALGDVPVSVRGLVGSPGTRTYQIWYRNAAAFCTSATYNLTNGLLVTWIP